MYRGRFNFHLGPWRFSIGLAWVLVTPVVVWMLAVLIMPIMAPTFSTIEAWGMALALVVLTLCSLVVHALGHALAGRLMGAAPPVCVALYPFGDAAHVWPAAVSPWREAFAALVGPGISAVVGMLAFLVWDLQLHAYTDVAMLYLSPYNLVLAIVNLLPGAPLDGGRITRAVVWGMLHMPERAVRVSRRLGVAIGITLVIWGGVLIAQRVRFSFETGGATLLAGLVLLLAIWQHRSWVWSEPPARATYAPGPAGLRVAGAGVIISVLLVMGGSLLPLTNGLYAPGLASAVEPMVIVPEQQRRQSKGSFLLTTVITQTPIVAAQWIYAQFDPAYAIVPPERVVPPDVTPQEQVARNFQMLQTSEVTAVIVGMRLAGYDAQVSGSGAEILEVVPESPARDLLRPGDVITSVNGQPVRTVDQLIAAIEGQAPGSRVDLTIVREGAELSITTALIPPAPPETAPRLGVFVQTAGFDYELPFPVQIEPQKIGGGPSAGLMFALTVYNLLTPEDLTGGRIIAGTGTIDLEGNVGPIGGVEQKVAGAERAGAEYFLVPAEHYEDALRAARDIKVVPVETIHDAIAFLRSLPPAPP